MWCCLEKWWRRICTRSRCRRGCTSWRSITRWGRSGRTANSDGLVRPRYDSGAPAAVALLFPLLLFRCQAALLRTLAGLALAAGFRFLEGRDDQLAQLFEARA